ncbi:MAG: hypothetical protein RLZZ500_2093 [Bacteroidota bacterium]|jgi:AraC-like DNA-binding protein
MKPYFENIPNDKGSASVYAYRFQVPFFEFKWHYHPEFELTYIRKGSGHRIVGNSFDDFTDGDLVLLGSGVPHTWSSKAIENQPVEAIVIQFLKAPLDAILAIEEYAPLHTMLDKAVFGLHFKASEEVEKVMLRLTEYESMDRVVLLLVLLNDLSKLPYTPIGDQLTVAFGSPKRELRINTICKYIAENFNQSLSIGQAAARIHMSESNFCKFFKKATGKTFSDYVNEIRIQEACRLLRTTETKISTLAHACGFETLSYFNRVFFQKKQCTPNNFRKTHSIVNIHVNRTS